MHAPDSILSKIRKLMVRTTENGCTEAEAASAFALASRLMADHQISMDSVATPGDDGRAEFLADGGHVNVDGRWRSEYDWAATICRDFFLVEVYRRARGTGNEQVFFGTPENVETARWVFTALIAAYDRLWLDYKRRTGARAGERRAFTLGVTHGFRGKLRDERREAETERECSGQVGTGLVLVRAEERIKNAFRAAHTNLTTGGHSAVTGSSAAIAAGRAAGRSLNLSRPIGSNGSKGLPGS